MPTLNDIMLNIIIPIDIECRLLLYTTQYG